MVQGTPTEIEMAMDEEEEQGDLCLGREEGMRKVNAYRPWKVTISTAAIFFLAMIPMKVKLHIYTTYEN